MSGEAPVAWRVFDTDGSEAVYSLEEQARAAAYEMNWSIEPLYRSPALTLTDEEREAIEWCLSLPMLDRDAVRMMPLRSLLKRLNA